MPLNGKIIGLRFDNVHEPARCAEVMKGVARELVAHNATYDLFLYPYVDALLLSREDSAMFGTHALLWGFDAKTLAAAVVAACGGNTAALSPKARVVENDLRDVAAFLSEGIYSPRGDELTLGGFVGLLSGGIRPWNVREHSRRFCSFCEQAARVSGVNPVALSGGQLILSAADDVDALCELYTAKTGGVATVTRA